MKYDILKDFKGSQDGRFAEDFVAGTQRDLSEWLAGAAPPGSIRPAAAVVDAPQPVAPEVKIVAVPEMKRKK